MPTSEGARPPAVPRPAASSGGAVRFVLCLLTATVMVALAVTSFAAVPSGSGSPSTLPHASLSSPVVLRGPSNVGAGPATGTSTELPGVDVSAYQGTITWSTVYSDGVRFAFAKAAEGNEAGCDDADWDANAVNGQAAGVYIGAYDFAEMPSGSEQACSSGSGADNATAEAATFDAEAGPYFKAGYMYPALDLEQGCSAEGDGSETAAEMSHWVGMWMSAVESYISTNDGYTIVPTIYMSESYAANCIESWITQFPLWVANWDVSSPGTGLYSSWAYWQYNDDCTTCGVAGDADYFNGNVTELADNYVFGGTPSPTAPTVTYGMYDNTTATALSCGDTFAAGDQIYFTSTVTGGTAPYTYAWTFGDGGTSALPNPSHVYTTAGTVNPLLTVTDANSLSGSTGTGCSFTVTGSAPFTATASATPTSGTAPLLVSFSGAATGGNGVNTYYWNFGGVGHSGSQNPTFTYTAAGTYDPKLEVNDSAGAQATASTTAITVSAATPPSVSISANVLSGAAPLSVSFTSSVTGGSGYTYAWSFGDGGTSTAADPTHSYTAAGTYSASVVVTDSAGLSGTSNALSITVSSPPATLAASVGANVTTGYASLAVQFSGSATGGSQSYTAWSWDFGDGTSGTVQDPTHTFLAAGSYPVTVTVTDSTGATATSPALTITVSSLPGSPLTVSLSGPSQVTAGTAATFTATGGGGTGTYTSYAWTFGDGGTATTSTATTSYTYESAGTYSASVTITDSSGATAVSNSVSVTVAAVSPEVSVLQGSVLDATSGAPLASAVVTLFGSSGTPIGSPLITPTNGSFRLSLSPGTITVNVTASGYHDLQVTETLAQGKVLVADFNLTAVPSSSGSPSGSSSSAGPWAWAVTYPGYLLWAVLGAIVVVGLLLARRGRSTPPEDPPAYVGPPSTYVTEPPAP